jgi:hypothetical protein
VVLGPSPDGGFYLLATARPLRELSGLPWQRSDTLAQLLAALRQNARSVTLLAPLRDLDRPQDLTRWLGRCRGISSFWSSLVALLRRALSRLGSLIVPETLGRPLRRPLPVSGGRSPPRFS